MLLPTFPDKHNTYDLQHGIGYQLPSELIFNHNKDIQTDLILTDLLKPLLTHIYSITLSYVGMVSQEAFITGSNPFFN